MEVLARQEVIPPPHPPAGGDQRGARFGLGVPIRTEWVAVGGGGISFLCPNPNSQHTSDRLGRAGHTLRGSVKGNQPVSAGAYHGNHGIPLTPGDVCMDFGKSSHLNGHEEGRDLLRRWTWSDNGMQIQVPQCRVPVAFMYFLYASFLKKGELIILKIHPCIKESLLLKLSLKITLKRFNLDVQNLESHLTYCLFL